MNEDKLERLFSKMSSEKSKGTISEKRGWLLEGVELALAMIDGDLNDYLFNETGGRIDSVINALKALGADEVAGILEEAVNATGIALPIETAERQAMLMQLDEEIIELWDELTEDYYDLEEDFWELLLQES